jgi:hypothetical protein
MLCICYDAISRVPNQQISAQFSGNLLHMRLLSLLMSCELICNLRNDVIGVPGCDVFFC